MIIDNLFTLQENSEHKPGSPYDRGVAGDQWSVECQGKEYKCNDETHAVNKARSLINYGGKSAIIKQNAKPKYKWALGQKMEPVAEARATRHSMPWSVWNAKSPQDQEFLLKMHPDLVITDKPRPVKPQREKINYGEIANKIEQIVGDTFPDGDPLDWLLPYMRRRWGTDHNAMQHLDRAARRVLGARNYYDYLETIWDQVADDELVPNVSHKNNPWRVSEARHVHTTKQDWMGLPNLGDPAKVDVQRDWKKPTTQTHCPGCYSQDIKTYSDGEKQCNQCHKTWDVKGVAEGRFEEPLTGWHIVYRKSGNPVHATPSFETKDQAQKYLMTKMFANHQDYKVVHTAGVGAVAEMDKSQPSHGRDGKISHSTYGSRDKKGSDYFKGKEAPGKAITAKQASKDALDILKKQGVTEGDVIRTKFATKQAQRARDTYQHQPDIEIPLYDRMRDRSVLPKYADLAGDQLEPFDHFETRSRSPRVTQIVGVTRDFRELVVSTMMAKPKVVSKFVDAMNRGGFSDVPIQRVPIKGYDVEEGQAWWSGATTPAGHKIVAKQNEKIQGNKFVYQGYVIEFKPTEYTISKALKTVYKKSGDYSQPTRLNLAAARRVVDMLVRKYTSGNVEEAQDACYHKVRSRYKVWPSAYASGALVQCRKKGAANWGTGGKKK